MKMDTNACEISGRIIDAAMANIITSKTKNTQETDASVTSATNGNTSVSFDILYPEFVNTEVRVDSSTQSKKEYGSKVKPGHQLGLERPSLSSSKGLKSQGRRSGASVASSSPDDLMRLQKQGVLAALKEAKKAELKRAKVLALVEDDKSKAWKVKELNRRYEEERIRDQRRVKQLLFDYEAMQRKHASGELRNIMNTRSERSINPSTVAKGAESDRFSRTEKVEDIIAWKRFCETFDKLGEKSERKFAPKVDLYAEKKRLTLLREKKHILDNMIQVHSRELLMSGINPGDRRDEITRCSSRSEASYATFASRNSRGRIEKTFESRRPHFVPPLPLSTTKLSTR